MQVFFCFFKKIFLSIDIIVRNIIIYNTNCGKYSKNNRFCQRVAGMIFDDSLKNVIASAYENETDVFLRMNPPCKDELISEGVRTAVLMPGGFLNDKSDGFYDIRCLGDEDFRKRLISDRVKRLVVLFAECADKSEYGYREAFGWIGEMRAEGRSFFQVVAYLSPCSDSVETVNAVFGCSNSICIGERILPDADVFRTVPPKAKFLQTAELCEKYAFKRSVVYFNSREEAGSFVRFLEGRGTRCAYADGALLPEEMKENILKFASGEINILAATKSYVPTSYFYPPEKVIFCGVPFSHTHLSRCAFTLEGEKPFIIYCEDDVKRNEKIIASFSQRLSDEEIFSMRISRLNDMVKTINIKENSQ